ncbi:unnamed protein product [Dibothriocephalus latus]|uniref:EF-hand domain-containing protein n=1 Tax=Dibothriocephalus latus TaxID=60516 RepID=A0A3P6PJ60_DIBLA|nr:unnamed protein product [Dibothriocephalus latus]
MTDSELSEERIQEIKEIFDKYDKENNGQIAAEDVANCLRSAGSMPSVVEVESYSFYFGPFHAFCIAIFFFIQDLIQEVDTEKNIPANGMSFEQFCQIAAKKDKDIYTNEDILKAFQVFDTESTGFLSRDILMEALCSSGENLSGEEFEAMMKFGGLDADGHFYYANFVNRFSG